MTEELHPIKELNDSSNETNASVTDYLCYENDRTKSEKKSEEK